MDPRPQDEMLEYEGGGLLAGACAHTGGDSGIGRAIAVAFAKEGADVAISYLSGQEDEHARHTAELAGQRCVMIRAAAWPRRPPASTWSSRPCRSWAASTC